MLRVSPLTISIVEDFKYLAALPLGGPLLGECGGALAGVLRREHGAGDLPLALPELILGPALALDHHALGGGERERAVGGDRAGQLQRGLERTAVVGEPVHEAELVAA